MMSSKNCGRISENVFYEHLDDIPADYVSDLSEEDENDYIAALPNILPATMFKCEGREITFLGPDRKLIEQWKGRIHQKVEDLTTDTIANGGNAWDYLSNLENAASNMLDVCCRFYFDDDGYAMKSTEFILDCLHMAPGEKLYVGAVIDYHL